MNIYQDVEHMLMEAFNKVLGPKDIGKIDQNLINVEPPRDKEHGDVATNAAMVFAKTLSIKPRDLAIKICNELDRNDDVSAVKVAGPGFINIKLVDEVWFKSLHFILKSGKDYGSSALGAGKKNKYRICVGKSYRPITRCPCPRSGRRRRSCTITYENWLRSV